MLPLSRKKDLQPTTKIYNNNNKRQRTLMKHNNNYMIFILLHQKSNTKMHILITHSYQ